MSRHRALAWAIVLALVVAAQFAPLPGSFTDSGAALAQGTTETEARAPTDLAVVALHCAEAPAAEALADYLATGAPPAMCAPAVGVAFAVTENEAPLPGSPFTTDVTGTVGIPVDVGSSVVVREDPKSLPSGYEPLAGEANGVPYANPVRLDSAVAGAAVLFVNVPAPVSATQAQDATAAETDEATELAADTATSDTDAVAQAASPALTCDPAYIAEPNYAIVPPAPKAGDIGGAVGSAPVAASGGTAIDDGTQFLSWNHHRGDVQLWFNRDRNDDWFVHGDGLWLWPRRIDAGNLAVARSDTDNVAVVSNFVRVGSGVWPWLDRADHWRQHDDDSWMWRTDRKHFDDWRLHDTGVWVWFAAAAQSGDENVAVSASSVRIDNGVWFRPLDRDWNDTWFWLDRDRDDDRRWFNRDRDDDWFVHDKGSWRWPGRIDISHLAAVSSGDDSIAIVASAVRIGTGLWRLPPNHFHHGVWNWPGRDHDDDNWTWPRRSSTGIWIWSGAIARSGDNVAISGSAIRIDTGLWLLPPSHRRTHDWLDRDDDDRDNASNAESLSIDGGEASEAPGKLEQSSDRDESTSTADEALVVESTSDDAVEAPADSAAAPADSIETPTDGDAAPASDGAAPETDVEPVGVAPAEPAPEAVEAPADGTVETPSDAAVESPSDTGATDSAPVDPAVDPSYVAPEPVVDSGYVAPEPVAEPVYVAPEPVADPGYVDPGYAEPAAVDPGYVDPGYAEPTYVEPTYVEPASVEPEPVFNPVAVDPGNGDFGNDGFNNVAPVDVGAGANGFGNSDFGGNEPAFVAPEPAINAGGADPGFAAADPVSVDPGNGGSGFGDAGNAAPDPGFGNGGGDSGMAAPDLGNAGPSNDAPAPISVDSGNGGGGGFGEGGNAAPDADAGLSEGGQDEG